MTATLTIWLYSLVSVSLISLISILGLMMMLVREETLNRIIPYLVGFSAGGLFGDAFIHLIPEAVQESGFDVHISLWILSGIVVSFIIEKFLQWRHCHIPTSAQHPHSFAYMNLIGDAVHNFIDGLIIGSSYIANIPLGVATTLAVASHEIPQELGDCGVLIHGGFRKSRALLFNFLTGLTAIFGAFFTLSLSFVAQEFTSFLIPFAAGSCIYIAGSDLIPELRRDEPEVKKSILQLASFLLGVFIMLSFIILE